MPRNQKRGKLTAATPLMHHRGRQAVGGCPSAAAQPRARHPERFRATSDCGRQPDRLPAPRWTASGIHTAKGFTTAAAQTTSVAGMKADCDNINLNRKLSTDFLRDVFGPGLIGFFYKCENISADTNQYWFTIASGDPAQIDKLCDPATQYPSCTTPSTTPTGATSRSPAPTGRPLLTRHGDQHRHR